MSPSILPRGRFRDNAREHAPGAGPVDRAPDGSLTLSADQLASAGITEHDEVVFQSDRDGLHLSADRIRKVYVEPTTRCNLDCAMCIRRAWAGSIGDMPLDRFRRIVSGLAGASSRPITVALAGYGEPLTHPDLFDMIGLSRDAGLGVELITNGFLVDRAVARTLCEAGVAQVTVSVDGGEQDSFEAMRGAELSGALGGLEALVEARLHTHAKMAIGIAAVATTRNVAALPGVVAEARRLKLEFVSISNVVAHTAEMASEALTGRAAWTTSFPAEGWQPRLRVARVDATAETRGLADALLDHGLTYPSPHVDAAAWRDRCRFVHEGMLAVSWDGRVAPCLSLLHTHPELVNGQTRQVKSWTVANVDDHTLAEIRKDPAYRAFRHRVRAFDFPPCLTCGGCPLTETNEEDCYQTPFPSCGACLWAQGLVLCP